MKTFIVAFHLSHIYLIPLLVNGNIVMKKSYVRNSNNTHYHLNRILLFMGINLFAGIFLHGLCGVLIRVRGQ